MKASELPASLRDALRADPDATVDVTATIVDPAASDLPSLASLIGSGLNGFASREEADAWVRGLRGEWDR